MAGHPAGSPPIRDGPPAVKWRHGPYLIPRSPVKIDAFLFLQRSDIAHHLRAGHDFGTAPLIFIDPGLAEEALKQGIDPQNFSYRPLSVGPHFHARIATEAATRAAALDQALTAHRQRLFGQGVFQGWDQGPMRLFFIRALVAKYLGELCERSFGEAAIGLYRPDKPQLFYFDSFLTTDLFAAGSARWRIVDHYADTAHWVPDHAAHCWDFADVARLASSGQAHAVTHIATCYHHHPHYVAEIERAFPANIDLPSPHWDIPVRRQGAMKVPLTSLPRDCVSDAALLYREAARQVLSEQLGTLVPSRPALQAQVDALAERCLVQAINYEGLRDSLRGTRPHFVITDHDTGSNGPLFSVAARLGAPITVLPHSSYVTGAIPHPLNVRVVERDGFATPTRSVWGEKVRTTGVQLGPVAAPTPRERAATVCLLVNTLASQGLSYIDFAGLARFHRALALQCAARGAELIVRLKPNNAGLRMASSALSVPSEALQTVLDMKIDDIARRTDLCICYGEPTTAGIEFLASGSYLMHASDQRWPADYLTSPAFLTDGTVPSFVLDEALAETDALLADDTLFRQRADAQRTRFLPRLTARDGRIFD